MSDLDVVIARIEADDAHDPLRVELGRWPRSTAAEVDEMDFGLTFPDEFRQIVMTIGASDIGYTEIYGIRPEQEPSIRRMNPSALQSHTDYIAFSDNGVGDYYGFEVRGGQLAPEVVFLEHETGERRVAADSVALWLEAHVFL